MNQRSVLLGIVVGVGLLASSPARAVDIENRDKKPQEVVINRTDGSSETLTLKPGQKLIDVCADCVILVGESSVEARGRTIVRIEGGVASIASQR